MNNIFLLPYGFKKIGWVILIPAATLGCGILLNAGWNDVAEHLINNIALIGTAIGLIFVGFSKEHHEDECITSLRLNSLLTAVYINYALMIVLALLFYDFRFLSTMFILLYTIPTIYLLLFRLAIYRLNKFSKDAE